MVIITGMVTIVVIIMVIAIIMGDSNGDGGVKMVKLREKIYIRTLSRNFSLSSQRPGISGISLL